MYIFIRHELDWSDHFPLTCYLVSHRFIAFFPVPGREATFALLGGRMSSKLFRKFRNVFLSASAKRKKRVKQLC